MFCSESESEFNTYKDQLSKKGHTFSNAAEEILKKSKHLKMCKSLSVIKDDWAKGIIDKRTENLANLAWGQLQQWLQ